MMVQSAMKSVARMPCPLRVSRFSSLSVTSEAAGTALPRDEGPPSPKGNTSPPTLQAAPTLPFVGSLLSQITGTPLFDPEKMYDYHPEMRRRYGEFYTFGFPSFGAGLNGIIHVTVDPEEMLKVVRSEGTQPSGVVERLWAFRKALKDNESALVDGDDYGLFGQGERWKKHRSFLQSGMLCPRAAKGFVPGIVSAAELASKGAIARRDELNLFLNCCAFDMFSTFMFGEMTRVADPSTSTPNKEENVQFCKGAVRALELSTVLVRSPSETLLNDKLGIDTKNYKDFKEAWDLVWAIGRKKVRNFRERYRKDELNDNEKASYLAGAIARQSEEGSDVSEQEMFDLCIMSLFVAVDTTSTVMAWNLVHLALNPDVQEKLHAELSKNVREAGGHVNANVITKSKSPYLHAVVQESHRLTPPFGQVLSKTNTQSEVDIHGITLPKGSVLSLDHIINDPAYVEDAREFKPERWEVEAVNSRAGTPSQIMDHALFRDPFSQGARRCPGSRVAKNEILALMSQLVLDYRIVSPVKSLDEIKYDSAPFIQPIIPHLEFIPRNP